MSPIIAGRFETQAGADAAVEALVREGFSRDAIARFHVNPPGAHSITAIGGDAHSDEGAKNAPVGAGVGAVAGGIAGAAIGAAVASVATPLAAPVGAAVGLGVGAWTGSLAGGLSQMRTGDPQAATPEQPVSRRAGPLVAVRIDSEVQRERAIATLRSFDAMELETSEGELAAGEWRDFDPRLPPALVNPAAAGSAAGNTITRPTVGPRVRNEVE